MNVPATVAPERMNAEEFIAWAMEQDGRYELVDGEVFAMSPERIVHARVKTRALVTLDMAIRMRGLGCEALGDGMAVRVADGSVFEPDAQVRCGPPLPDDDAMVTDPMIVVEVLSPSSRDVDTARKLGGYFSLPSVRHYLVLDPLKRSVVHYRRDGEGLAVRLMFAGEAELALDPPGLAIPVAHLFEAP